MQGTGTLLDAPEKDRFGPEVLAAANINPVTRLATDYLNHFNNVVMLLELVPSMPDFADEVLAWKPASYVEYFATSHFRERELAIAAYGAADRDVRATFEAIIDELDQTMAEAKDLLRKGDPSEPVNAFHIGELVTHRLKPLITEAGGVINGMPATPAAEIDLAGINAQETIDELFP
ncbi:hypothetical protein [Methyloraptor flagellatus]|uniref:Uncharacterized protein n=1 Tax=Methyloraptor flagellatus TaxID=3162530 RepID=A0AAU7X5L4_9HYPH